MNSTTNIAVATGRHSGVDSPTSSISLMSPPLSYDRLSDETSDERIVWSGSNSCVIIPQGVPRTPISEDDDDDYVLLSPSNAHHQSINLDKLSNDEHTPDHDAPSATAPLSVDSLIPGMGKLTVESRSNSPANGSSPSKARRARRRANRSPPVAAPTKVSSPNDTKSPTVNKKHPTVQTKSTSHLKERSTSTTPTNTVKLSETTNKAAMKHKPPTPTPQKRQQNTGFGQRPVVDDVSECGVELSLYEHAAELMGSVLSSTQGVSPSSRLEILQALIIELGLVTSEVALPTSITSARTFLRSHVFVNIRDYLAARDKGQDALRQVMHKNRASLIKDLRKKKQRRAPLPWVKESGLSVLLVSCY